MKKKNLFKRILSFTLSLVMSLSVLSFVSCDRSYDEEVVTSEAKRLLKNCEVLNEVYFGKGISYISTGQQNGSYYEADAFHLKALGFSTLSELRQLTRDTYSSEYTASLFSTKLDSSVAGYVRYYQKYQDELTMEEPECIMVYNNIEDMTDGVKYDYSSVRATGSEGEIVNIEVTATVTADDGKSQNITMKIQLVEEDSGWRINNPTHAKYNEYLDIYEDLVNSGLE